MAEAVGKATGRPGICFVTRGPGATNASPGIHIAQQDSTPMIMFVGQVARDVKEREALQELDLRAVFGGMTKWATEIDDAGARPRNRLARLLHRDQRPAGAGRDRPAGGHADRARHGRRTRRRSSRSRPGRAQPEMAKLEELLAAAQRPLLILGGSRWSRAGARGDRSGSPNASRCRSRPATGACRCSIRCIRATPATSASVPIRSCRAHQGRRSRRRCSAAGSAKLPRRATRCSIFRRRARKLVHVHPGAEELGRVYRPHLAIHAAPTRVRRRR